MKVKSKDMELCQALENALASLRTARLTTGYVAVTGRLRESEALDLDGIISALKSIYLVACHTVVEDAEKSEEGTGDQEYWESVVAANPRVASIGKLAWLSPEEVQKNREVEQLLSIATPILASLIQSDATTCTSEDLVPPSDLADLTMLYVNSLVTAVRKDVDSRMLCNGN